MKSIYLSDMPEQLRQVYAKEIREELEQSTSISNNVFCWEDIKKSPHLFQKVENIFSTWGMPAITESELEEYFPNLKHVFYAAGSVQYFARPFLNRGVRVFNAAAANAIPVAEYTLAVILLANKGFFQAARITERKKSCAHSALHMGNYGAKVGIIGAGMVGKLVIQKLRDYQIQVVTYDPFLPDSIAEELDAAKVSLPILFESCDVISNHLPNNRQTAGMLNYSLFSRMKPWATFINTGRGAQVVEKDLTRAMEEKPDATAILDVTDPEPCPENHPFHTLKNVFLTPHIAGSMNGETSRMAKYMAEEWRRIQNREAPKYEITLQALEIMA